MARTVAWRAIGSVTALAFSAPLAHSAAIEQAIPSTIRLLYEDGMYAEFGLSYLDPDQSGEGAVIPSPPAPPPGLSLSGNTGDLFEDRWNFSAAWKNDINEQWSYIVAFDQPFWAATNYGSGTFLPNDLNFTYEGSLADLKTYQISGVVAYDIDDRFKVYGGLRAQRLEAKAAIPFIAGYSVDADKNWGYGYLLGAAYARPEIGLRIGLTYSSKISHDLGTKETTTSLETGEETTQDTNTDVDTPQSLTLDAQTGIAEGTLLFGSIRWVDWSEFSIEPPVYEQATEGLLGQSRPLVDYADDWWTYNLGIARQLTDDLAGSLSVTYEPSVGGELTTLGPYDGRTTGTAALSYDYGQFNITGGITYGVLGDTENLLQTDFNDGSVWGAGLRVGYTF